MFRTGGAGDLCRDLGCFDVNTGLSGSAFDTAQLCHSADVVWPDGTET